MTDETIHLAAAQLPLGTPGYIPTLLESFERNADRTAIIHSSGTLSYGEIRNEIYRLARALSECGLRRGDGIAVLADNTPGTLLVGLAAQLMGCYFVGLAKHASVAEQTRMLTFTEVSALVFEPLPSRTRIAELMDHGAVPTALSLGSCPGYKDLLAAAARQSSEPLPPQGRGEDVADVVFTGGSSGGHPKAAVHTFARMAALAQAWQEAARQGDAGAAYRAADCRLLRFVAATDTPGVAVLPTLLNGGALVLQEGFDAAAVLKAIEQHRISVLALYPSHLYQLLDHPDVATTDHTSLRLLVYYGAPVAPARLQQAVEVFGPVLCQIYGQSETRMLTTLLPAEHSPDRPELMRSVGRARPGVELEIRTPNGKAGVGEIGEICARTAYQMDYYWKDPELTSTVLADGWVRTKDVGYQDSEGYVYLVDRQRDIVLVNSFNCYTFDIENLLAQHPAVKQAAVVGIPDERTGEAVHASVVLHPGSQVSEIELCELVRRELGELETPKSVVFLDELPVTRIGKPDKNALRRLVMQADH